MKRRRTVAKIRLVARTERGGAVKATDRTQTVTEPRARKPELTLARAGHHTHTLIPTGRLDRRSAPILEAELERLYETGVTRVVLDLRELSYVDSTGVAVLAFRSELCKRHGHELGLIPGSRLMRRAFEEAGVTELLTPPEDAAAASRLAAAPPADAQDVAATEGSRAS